MYDYLKVAILLLAMAALTTQATERTWTGSVDADWFDSGNWNPDSNYPQAGDTVIIPSGKTVLLTNATAELASFSITNATLTFSNWTTRLIATNVTIKNNGALTLPSAFPDAGPSNRVWVVCETFTLNAGGQINADGKGYASQNGPGKGANAQRNTSGGGYGGRGGNGSGTVGGSPYGSTNAPLAPGSGGGYDTWTAYQNGQGGGAVRIQSSGSVTIDGTISANGTRVNGSAGSGGAIYISCTTFGGGTSGVLRANGGIAAGNYGGGGGGRIAVTYTEVSGTVGVRFGAAGGTGYVTDKTAPTSAQMGTVYLSDTNVLSDVWKNQIQGATLHVPGFTAWTGTELVVSNAFVGLPEGFALNVSNILVEADDGVFLGANQDLALTNLTLMDNALFMLGTNSAVSCSNLSVQAGAKLKMLTNAVLACGQAMEVGAGASVIFQADTVLTCGGDILLNQGQLDLGVAPVLNCAGNMTLTNSASLTVYSGPTNGLSVSYGARVGVTNTLVVAPNSWIYPWSDTADGGSVLFSVGTLTILPGGGINANGRGYASQKGLGKGGNGSQNAAGGGYGGRGGNGSSSTGGSIYGSTNAPIAPGSGGGYDTWTTYQHGQGGGAVRIEATHAVTMDGLISANGTRDKGAAGSGGAIYITCMTFGGDTNGVLRADGGSASGNYGGGGGGRIAVWAGVSDAVRDLYLAGTTNAVIRATTNRFYLGSVSVTNGVGYVNEPPNGAENGTAYFFTPKPVMGSLLIIL